jgi:lipopolysaccharide transport system ATP-binding protein
MRERARGPPLLFPFYFLLFTFLPMSTVIQVQSLSKRYRIGLKEKKHDTFIGQLGGLLRAPIDNYKKLRSLSRFGAEDESVFWALRDINFEVQEGEVLGIIGHNGAGKSTLLKILSRITEPSAGQVRLKGRVSALLEVGTGFHPELTGRENIYMNGTILGMTKREIDRKLDEIIDFSGVEKYIDTPVKFYSSGMRVRLAFSVAAHLEPEILIIDEVLAVGDAEFQKKCLGKMKDVSGEGRTVLFVSHNMGAVNSLCDKAILLRSGELMLEGETDKVILKYFEAGVQVFKNEVFFQPPEDIGMKIHSVKITRNSRLAEGKIFDVYDRLGFELEVSCFEDLPNRGIIIHCRDQIETIFQVFDLSTNEHLIEKRRKGIHRVMVELPTPLLKEGIYYFDFESAFFGRGADQLEKNVFEIEVKVLSKNPRYQSATRHRPGRIAVEPKWSYFYENN